MISQSFFSRCNPSVLIDTLHNKYITTEEFSIIDKFFNEDLLHNITDEDIQFLKSLNFKVNHCNENRYKIIEYPYLKSMCLTYCKKNPRFWKFEDVIEQNFICGFFISIDECKVIKTEEEFNSY